MNTNKYVKTVAGTDYFILTEASIAAFGFNVKTWAGEKVTSVDVHKRTAGNPRKLTVVTESGRRFIVTTDNCQVPLHHFA